MRFRSIASIVPALVLVGATLAAPTASASAPTKRVFAPSSQQGRTLVFHLRGVTPRSVRTGYLKLRNHRHTLRAETLRAGARRGRLKVRVPAVAQQTTPPAAARLVVVVKTSRRGLRRLLHRVTRPRRLRHRLLARWLLAPLRGRLTLQHACPRPSPGGLELGRDREAPDRLGRARGPAFGHRRHHVRLAAPDLLPDRLGPHRAPLREVGALLEASAVHPGRSARSHLRTMAATHNIKASGSARSSR